MPQNHWTLISSRNPNLFIWTGDSVYAPNNKLDGLQRAYKLMSSNLNYTKFIRNTEIDGVWDDHGMWNTSFTYTILLTSRNCVDYGVNDAGRLISHRDQRQHAFLDFLQYPKDSILRTQDGLYHYNDIVMNSIKIRIIYLDTRSHRDSHWIRSVGKKPIYILKIIGFYYT